MTRRIQKISALGLLLIGANISPGHAQDGASSWSSQCISRSRSAEAVCTLSHRVTLQETGQLLFVFEIRTRPEAAQPDMIVTAPIGFYLPDGISLAVDGKAALDLIIERCDQNSCYARQDLTQEALAAMQSGQKLQVTFSPARNNSQTLEIPLTGFEQAYAGIAR